MSDAQELKIFADFSEGQIVDSGGFLEPPAWLELKNFYFDSGGRLRSRPFLNQIIPGTGLGLASDSYSKLISVTQGQLFLDGSFLTAISGNGPVSFANSRGFTVVTAGGSPVVIDANGSATTLSHPNVKSVATATGPFGSRLFFVRSDQPRTLYYTRRGDLNDIGKVLPPASTDLADYQDEKTEGGRIKGWKSDILDVTEFSDVIWIKCRKEWYILTPAANQQGWRPRINKIADVDSLDVQTKRADTSIVSLTKNGLMNAGIGETGPFVQLFSNQGVRDSLSNDLVESEAKVGLDRDRGLYYVKTSNTGRIWVFNTANSKYTESDLDFNDMLTIEGETFVSNTGGIHGTGDNSADNTPITLSIRSGLSIFDAPNLKKRFKRIGMFASSFADFKYFMRIDPLEGFNVEGNPNYAKWYKNPVRDAENAYRAEIYTGKQSTYGSLHAIFSVTDKFVLNYLYSQVKTKANLRQAS